MQFSNVFGVGVVLGVLGMSGCISDPADNDGLPPPSGTTAQDIVIEAMEGLHFASNLIIDGEPREIVTYEGDSGQICMAILGLPYPNPTGGDEPSAFADEWFVYSAQATMRIDEAGEPLFFGKIYWDDGSEDWIKVGDYNYFYEATPSQIFLSLDDSLAEPRFDLTETSIESFISLLEPCSKLSNPTGSASPTPPPPPAPTPI